MKIIIDKKDIIFIINIYKIKKIISINLNKIIIIKTINYFSNINKLIFT